MIDWEAVAYCYGCVVEDIPPDLVVIFEQLYKGIREANSMSFTQREEYGLCSTQIIALVVLLYKKGVLK